MRLRISLLLLFCLSISVATTNAQDTYTGDLWSEAKANGSGTITAVYLEEDAFAYTNKQGELTGVEIDIFNQFVNWVKNAKGVVLDVNYVKESESFGDFYESVQQSSGGVFGLGTVTILERRKSEVQFTPPWINNIAVLVTHESVGELGSMDQLASQFEGMTAIAISNTTLEDRIENLKNQYYPGLNVEYVDSQNKALQKVAEGDGSYFTYLDVAIYWPAMQEGAPIRRHAIGDKASEQFGFIMPLSSDWQPIFEEFFTLGGNYRSSAAYRKILVDHLGPEYTKMLEMAQKK